ncbi:MAG: threonine aldolase [Bacteroidales bacterium]|nr:threonine aldolase [Bacteroidales bacterium]
MKIDLRSDTVTRPTEAMREAMFSAPVGDDVFGEDPSVIQLEEYAARLFDMEAALFCPSGTMTNQLAIKVHTQPGDEVICDHTAHIYIHEGGGIAFHSGCSVRLLAGNRGRFTAQDVEENINTIDVHHPVTRLVSIENTCNKGGGSIWDFDEIIRIRRACTENGLNLHLNGDRIFNALAATGDEPAHFGRAFDSISVCLSKGLGAPVGSLLLGGSDFIRQARRFRRMMGGGMRQAGYLAAAGSYALHNNIPRLADDHARAKTLGAVVQELSFVEEVLPVETNIVLFRLNEAMPAGNFIKMLAEKEMLVVPFGKQYIRMVTHLDINDDHLEEACSLLRKMEGRM